jgi:hypothetical protein
MIGYKVLTSSGLKGPFMKSSLIKAITSAMVPLQARVLELETNRYLYAADLVGERIDPKDPALCAGEYDVTMVVDPKLGPDDKTIAMSPEEILKATKPKRKKSKRSKAEQAIAKMAQDRTMAMSPEEILAVTKDKLKQAPKAQLDEPEELRLDEETPGDTDTPRVILRTNPLLKKHVRMPKRRKLSEKSEAELDHSAA